MSTAIEPTAEAVLKLPLAQKRALLSALVNDLEPAGPVYLGDGVLIYRPLPNAMELAEESFRHTTVEELEESARLADAPDSDLLSVEQLLKAGEEDDKPA